MYQSEYKDRTRNLTGLEEVGLFINRITFKNKSTIDLEDGSIIVFVGPNNSGKSLSLREISSCLSELPRPGKLIENIEIQRIGDKNKLLNYINPFLNKKDGSYRFGNSEYRSSSHDKIIKYWESNEAYIGDLSDIFVSHLNTEKRLADCLPSSNFDATVLPNGFHPIHGLYLDQSLELYVSDLFNAAFGHDLILHRSSGTKIPIYVGTRPQFSEMENAVSRTYLDKIENLEKLEDQGDGFKSFTSVLLRVWTGYHNILLLDEPEAFLHPPQARLLGELIAERNSRQRQIFISTHSNEIIQGIISKAADRVTIIRLDRLNNNSTVNFLDSSKITDLWKDPILRYSNSLNGLFHTNVVVTESDADCRFYEAMAKNIENKNDDIFYTYAGGKDRIPVIVRALKALHVPVQSIVDFDVFANDNTIKHIIEAHGHGWSDYKADISYIRQVIQSKKNWLVGSGFKARFNDIMQSIDDDTLVQKSIIDKIRNLMREASPWENVKSVGLDALPSGDPNRKAQELLRKLGAIGIYVVPVGEMEGFCRTVGNHGPRWVENVLNRDLASDPDLENARKFVAQIISQKDIGKTLKPLPEFLNRRFSKKDYYSKYESMNLKIERAKNIVRFFAWIVFAFYYVVLIFAWVMAKISEGAKLPN